VRGLWERARRSPAALRWITLAAVLNALAWGILVPPFHVPDETAHVAYVQYLAETGKLPKATAGAESYSAEIRSTLAALNFHDVIGRPEQKPPASREQLAALEAVRDERPPRVGSGDVPNATNNPPLYYAIEAAVYRASPSDDLLTRLALMRIVSALLAGATALFGALFVRELLPGSRWAWAAGGLAIAVNPLLGFIGGGVNNDNLLFCAAAAVFVGLARMFRRGVTPARAVFVAVALALGALAKATLVAFAPAVAFAFVALVMRAGAGRRRGTLRAVAVGVGAGLLPIVLFVVLSATVWDRPIWGAAATSSQDDVLGASLSAGSLRAQLSYTWQLFLPKLGLFTPLHPVPNPPADLWLAGFVGRFGWLDYGFPAWVYNVADWVAPLVAALAATTLVRERRRVRGHALELAAYVLAVVGLAMLIGFAGYQAWLGKPAGTFEQARYLLPLLPLYGALVALAVRAAGRRAGPGLAAACAVVLIAWSVYAQVLTALRYYG
jgi:hypothetical protein